MDSDDSRYRYMIYCKDCGHKYYYWGKNGWGGIE